MADSEAMVMVQAKAVSAAARYLDALLGHDRGTAKRIVDEALRERDIEKVYVDVLQQAMYELGERWERGEITVAQEHFCTAATQQIMAALHADRFEERPGGRRLLAMSVGGNHHSVGVRMVADTFEIRGWSVVFVGADTPTDAAVAMVSTGEFDVIALSAALSHHVREVDALVRAVRAAGSKVRILVGGRAFQADRELWRTVGADGYAATPSQAVTLAEALTSPAAPRHGLTLVAPSTVEVAVDDARTLAAMTELNTELHDMARALVAKNAELARVNGQLNRVMGVIAHDLRNPLSVVTHYAHFLREDLSAVLGDEQREFLDMIDSSSEFMRQLLDDLLDTARLRAGKLKLERELVDLDTLIRDVSALNQHLAQRKAMELRVKSSANVHAMIDRGKMRQVLNNLVSNAVKYSAPGTVVEIELVADAGAIAIAVRDHGLGIAPEALANLFVEFETSRTHGTAGEKSTGLGLAIARAIVEAHGGRIDVASTLGEGSVFTVTLARTTA